MSLKVFHSIIGIFCLKFQVPAIGFMQPGNSYKSVTSDDGEGKHVSTKSRLLHSSSPKHHGYGALEGESTTSLCQDDLPPEVAVKVNTAKLLYFLNELHCMSYIHKYTKIAKLNKVYF